MAFAPTAQQVSFLTALTTTASNLALVARAGCGKTSTILLAVDAIAKKWPRAEVLVCAFNKSIADEVGAKLKQAGHTEWRTVQASTLHSMGWGLLRFAYKLDNKAIDDKKVRSLIKAQNEAEYEHFAGQIEALVGYAKQAGVGFFPDLSINSVDVWAHLADHYDVNGFDDTTDTELVISLAQNIYRLSLAQTDVVDFNDMILFPLIKNLRVKFGKDFIFLDEAQDLSRTRQALARKFLKYGVGRMIVVGDDRQAIYGFTGADAAALSNLIQSLNATVMPLTVTWRCPKAVVRLAQSIVPDIEAAASADEGSVTSVFEVKPQDLLPTDAILCRNTAPLIDTAYKLIREGVACKVEGRAIGEGLKQLIGRWKVKSIDALMNRIDAYQDREVQKAMAKDQEQKAEQVIDKCETIRAICRAVIAKGQTTVADVNDFITDLFSDEVKGVVTLCTYHRAKGREWPRVILIRHNELCPSRAAKQDWQRDQEANLAYVAFTRAQQSLVFWG